MQNYDIYEKSQLPLLTVSVIDFSNFGLIKYVMSKDLPINE